MHVALFRNRTRRRKWREVLSGAAGCRLKLKMVARVTMDDLAQHLGRQLAEWPSQQLQALETVVNSPFIADTGRLIYSGRSLFDKRQVRFSRVMYWGFILKLNLNFGA
jgi:hypothetical protein